MDAQKENSAWAWKGSRLQGLVILGAGLVSGYFSIVRPLQQAYSHASEISWSFKLAFLSPVLVIVGILATIVPSTTTDQTFILSAPNKLSLAGWVLVIALAIVGFGTYYLFDQRLSSLGYN